MMMMMKERRALVGAGASDKDADDASTVIIDLETDTPPAIGTCQPAPTPSLSAAGRHGGA